MPAPWFDAHLDLAALAVNGRDLLASLSSAGGPWQPAAVTLPSLRAGGVRCALGTIFIEPDGKDAAGYPAGDVDAAHRKARAQLEVYLTLQDKGEVALDLASFLRVDSGVGETRGGMGVSETSPRTPEQKLGRGRNRRLLHLGVLVEGADAVRTPDDLPWWVERGVVAIGLSWWRSSRYAGGNGEPGRGLTDLGRAMIEAMDALSVVHDASHLSEKSFNELLERTDRPVIASHSNCRAIVDPSGADERHLTDDQIREIGRRGGVVGVNLVSNFIDPEAKREPPRRARLELLFEHIDRICGVMGRRDGVGLGSDMDGGFSAEWLPDGLSRPADLGQIADGLESRGWSTEEIDGFRFSNWARFFGAALGGRRRRATSVAET